MERIRLKMFAQILETYQHLSLLLSTNPGEAIQHFFFFFLTILIHLLEKENKTHFSWANCKLSSNSRR